MNRSRYKLHIMQGPLRARMCGFGNKDYRPLDPIPVIQVLVLDENTNEYIHPRPSQVTNLLCTARAYSVKLKTEMQVTINRGQSSNRADKFGFVPPYIDVLFGSAAVTPEFALDPQGEEICIFCFTELSVRTGKFYLIVAGEFQIKFSLFDTGANEAVDYVQTAKFQVFAPSSFPGILGEFSLIQEPSELTRALAQQGFKIQGRGLQPY